MKLISHFLLVLYAGLLLCQPVVLFSEKSQNPFSDLAFSINTPIAKIYTSPLILNAGSTETQSNIPIIIIDEVNAFTFNKTFIRSVNLWNQITDISGITFIKWRKIAINAP
jgi:hypothetical protein